MPYFLKKFFTAILITVFVATFLAVILSAVFTGTFKKFVINMIAAHLMEVVEINAENHITEFNMENWRSSEARLSFQKLEQSLRFKNLLRISVFNKKTIMVWSNKKNQVENMEVHDILEIERALNGETVSQIASNTDDLERTNVLEFYIPFYLKGPVPAGVIEFYYDLSEVIFLERSIVGIIWIVSFLAFFGGSTLIFYVFYRQNKEFLSQSKKLETIIERSPFGIYTMNRKGIIDSFNPKMLEIAGAGGEKEIVGLNALNLSTYKKVGLDKFFIKGLKGEPFEVEKEYVSYTHKRRSIRHYFGIPLFDESGNVEHLMLIVEDITKRKDLENKVAEYTKGLESKVAERTKQLETSLGEAKKLAGIVEKSFDAIALADYGKKNLLRYVNKSWEKMFGFTKEEAVDKKVPLILESIKKTPDLEKNFWSAIRDKKLFSAEVDFKCKRGLFIPIEVFVHPILKDNGEVVIWLNVVRDIREKKKSEAKIKELDELKNKFIAIVSHQLRTPLNAIRWNLESLLTEELGELKKEQREFMRVTYEANNEVIKRIDDLLTAIDIEEGRITVVKELFSFESVWNSVMQLWKKRCILKNLDCVYRAPSDTLPPVVNDSKKIRAILEKLIDNAVTYTPEDGKINVSIKQDGDYIVFEIRDNGIGIPSPEQSRLFTRFFRATNAVLMKPDASGLGLYISKYFVKACGGEIWFKSGEGSGSKFWIKIPIK